MLDGAATKVIGEIRTGKGTHGLFVSRDAKELYVTNRVGQQRQRAGRRTPASRYRALADPRTAAPTWAG